MPVRKTITAHDIRMAAEIPQLDKIYRFTDFLNNLSRFLNIFKY